MEAVAGAVALGGVLATVGALVVLHLLPTGLSPLRDPVSQYGISHFRLGYRVATICTGIAGIALAVGVTADLRGSPTVVAILLVAFGVARLVIGWFPMDRPGTPSTPTGRRHGVLAVVTFVSVTLAAQRLAGFLAMTGQWRDVVQSIRVVGSYMVVTILAMLVAGRTWLRSYFGLVERAFYAGMLTFLVLTSVKLVTGHLM